MFGFGAVMRRLIYLARSGGFSHVENEILADIMELEMIISLKKWKLVLKGKGHVLSKQDCEGLLFVFASAKD